MIIDISKSLFAKDKEDGSIHTVTGIYLPLGKPSGKDLTIDVGGCDEWRTDNDVELLSQGGCLFELSSSSPSLSPGTNFFCVI